ncbi:hypothetical protein [Confluentibacter sediminis]|uniref:hypothetical protein n=1 Tax=Confluentibacter sediminis TaxID=2219045 RepID=UPI000DAC5F49|nr:hypothetical protein [Confluentibacter sediminis]
MEYSFEETKKEIDYNYDFLFLNNSKQDDYHLLSINDKKYLFEGYSSAIPFEKDGVVVVNMWWMIVIFSLVDGKLLYSSGLNESFVGIESLDSDYLVVTDVSLFMINKASFYPWGYKTFIDHVQDYELLKEDYDVKLYFETEEDVFVKLNSI